jgi:EKC/KEOPS complex subunit CGI121/TPRKB
MAGVSQITEAIRRFGVSDTANSLLVVSVSKEDLSDDIVESAMKKVVEGECIPLDSLQQITDWALVKKVSQSFWIYSCYNVLISIYIVL